MAPKIKRPHSFSKRKPIVCISKITRVHREQLSLSMTSQTDLLRSSIEGNDQLYFDAVVV